MSASMQPTTLTDAILDGSRPRAAYKVDTSAGEMRGDVSAQWASRPEDQRFNTLSDLYSFKKGLWDRSRDIIVPSDKFEVAAPSLDFDTTDMTSAQMVAEGKRRTNMLHIYAHGGQGGDVQSSAELAPTNWCFGQLAKMAEFPSAALRKLPTPIVADVMNWQLRHNTPRSSVKLWATPDEAMAAQSESYGRISDHDVVAALMTIAGDGLGDDPRFHWKTPGKIDWANGTYDPENIGPASDHTFYGSDRDLFCFLVDDRRPIVVGKTRDGNDDLMFRGFYIQNSMVGARSLKVACFYLRGVCMNRNLWGVERFEEIMIRHTSGAPERWLQQAKPALDSFARSSDVKLIEGVQRAKAKVLVEKDEEALSFLKRRGFTERASRDIIATSETEEARKPRTVWDFGQAITAYARTARNSDDRLDHELKAKAIFDTVN